MCFGIFWKGYLNLEVEEVLRNDEKNDKYLYSIFKVY